MGIERGVEENTHEDRDILEAGVSGGGGCEEEGGGRGDWEHNNEDREIYFTNYKNKPGVRIRVGCDTNNTGTHADT